MAIVIDESGPDEAAKKTSSTKRNETTSAGTPLTGFAEILRMSKVGGTISGEAATYIDNIQSTFDKKSCGIKNQQLPLEDKVVVAFFNKAKTKAITLTMVDVTMEAQREEPASDIAYQISKILQKDGCSLMNNIIVVSQDYPHASKMARHLILSLENPAAAAFEASNKDVLTGRFKVTMNVGDVNTLSRAWYPLESLPRTDIGLILWAKVAKDAHLGNNEWEWEPVMTITAYTQFVDRQSAHGYMFSNNAAQPKITPKITITSVQTSIASSRMYGLALLFAAEYFIKRNGWLVPYEKFGKDNPNLGSLIPDTKGKPFSITNAAQLQEFLSNPNVLAAPTLAVDVTEGRPCIAPQFDLLPGGSGRTITESLAKFFANGGEEYYKPIIEAGALSAQADIEYVGYVNGDKDSRIVDYLKLVADGASDLASAMRFLYIAPEPHLKGQWISEIVDYVSLFRNHSVLINPHVIGAISKAGLKLEVENDLQSPHNNIGLYGDQYYADFSGLGTIGTSGQPAYSSPNFTPYSL